jgi:DUF971 family protein
MKPAEKIPQPTGIDQSREGMRVTWNDGKVMPVSARALRLGCPCAVCVEEWTGKRVVDAAQVPVDIGIERIESVGSYAVNVVFTDTHATGIFSWKTLRQICDVQATLTS